MNKKIQQARQIGISYKIFGQTSERKIPLENVKYGREYNNKMLSMEYNKINLKGM